MSVNPKLEKFPFQLKPYQHQLDALKKGWGDNAFALFMEMGTGKSKVLIDNVSLLASSGRIDFCLVIAPKGVYKNWTNIELPKHMPEHMPYRVITWVANPNKAQQEELHSVKETYEGMTFFVMNIEALSSKKGQMAAEWLGKKFGGRGLIAIDESTTIKNPKAKRTKAMIKVSHLFNYRRILTGSPVTQSPLDLYAQCEALGPRTLGFESYYAFQNRYAVINKRQMGAHAFQQIVGYKNVEELTEKIDEFSFRVRKKDTLDLPEKVYTVRYIQLTDDQATKYNDIRNEAMTLLDSGDLVSTPSVMTQMLRLQQILSGHIKTDEGDVVGVQSNRPDAVMDILEEASGKVIIWSRFRYDIQQLEELINSKLGPGTCGSYYGDTDDEARANLVRDFQDPDSSVRVFIGNPQTAGYGLTLTEATTVIYYANDFNLETRIQSEDRCHRIGQKNTVTYIDLISEKTIDEKIVGALRKKIEISAKTLGEEAQEWLKLDPKSKGAST